MCELRRDSLTTFLEAVYIPGRVPTKGNAMILRQAAMCYGCSRPLSEGNYVEGAGAGDTWRYLCLDCCDKVCRADRKPRQAIEAILIFNNDPDVGGPDDPIDHEDYRDLELLGLWPET